MKNCHNVVRVHSVSQWFDRRH